MIKCKQRKCLLNSQVCYCDLSKFVSGNVTVTVLVTIKTPNSRNKVTHLNTNSFRPVKNIAKNCLCVLLFNTELCSACQGLLYRHEMINTKYLTVSLESMITRFAFWAKIPQPLLLSEYYVPLFLFCTLGLVISNSR